MCKNHALYVKNFNILLFHSSIFSQCQSSIVPAVKVMYHTVYIHVSIAAVVQEKETCY